MSMRFLIILFLSIFSSAVAQYGFQQGLMITANRDTLICYFPVSTSFGDEFPIKRTKDGVEEIMRIEDVKYLATSYTVFQLVEYKEGSHNKQKLMQILTEGTIILNLELIINEGHPTGRGGYTPYGKPTTTYVARKNNQNFLIEKKTFNEDILPLIKDAQDLFGKIGKKGYRYDDLESIIKEYNASQLN